MSGTYSGPFGAPGSSTRFTFCNALATCDRVLEFRSFTLKAVLRNFIPNSRIISAFNYHNHRFCRLPINSILGFTIRTNIKDGYGSQWYVSCSLLHLTQGSKWSFRVHMHTIFGGPVTFLRNFIWPLAWTGLILMTAWS